VIIELVKRHHVVIGGPVVSALACVRGFKHGRLRFISNDDRIQQHAFLRNGRKAAGDLSNDFTAR
jgi:hypothetical protein